LLTPGAQHAAILSRQATLALLRVPPRRCGFLSGLAILLLLGSGAAAPAPAGSLSREQLTILGKALAFLDPPLAGQPVAAVVYRGDDAESRQDAANIAALLPGISFGGLSVQGLSVAVDALPTVRFQIVIAARGVNDPAVLDAAAVRHALCLTADVAAVQAGRCTLAIRSNPKIEIFLNRNAMARSGIGFATAFRMMVQEQ
jgi:hypothetical protein